MGIIVMFLYLFFFTESLMLLFKKRFLKVLPLSFIITAIVMFFSQLIFKTFLIGYIVNILFCFIFPIYLIKNKYSFNDIKKKYIDNDFKIFVLFYILIILVAFNRTFTRWDELSHWGKMVKEMLKNNLFYSDISSNLLVHKDYPPIISLMEMFFAKISGGYRETYLYRSLLLFNYSLIISFIQFTKNNKNNIKMFFIILITSVLLTFGFDLHTITLSIYIDYVMSIYVAYLIFNLFKKEEFKYSDIILLSFSLIFLLLMKQVTIAFYLMVLFFLIFKLLINKYRFNINKVVVGLILLIVVPIISLMLWNNYIDSLKIIGQFNLSDIMINELIEIIKGTGGLDWQHTVVVNYIDSIIHFNLFYSFIKISYLGYLFVYVGLSILLYFVIKDKVKLKNYVLLNITNIIGYFGYAFMMLLLYIYSFGEYEGVNLASFDRYMSTYILLSLFILFFIYIYYNSINMKYFKIYVLFIIALLIIINPYSYLKNRPWVTVIPFTGFDEYKESAEYIDKYVENNSKVFIIDQQDNTHAAMFDIAYYSNKISNNLDNYIFNTSEEVNEEYFDNNYFNIIKDYDYLYIFSSTDELINKYNFLIDGTLKEKELYKIEVNDCRLKLVRVEN